MIRLQPGTANRGETACGKGLENKKVTKTHRAWSLADHFVYFVYFVVIDSKSRPAAGEPIDFEQREKSGTRPTLNVIS